MNLLEAVKARHAVRSYTDKKIEPETEEELRRLIDTYNKESGLHMQLFTNEPEAFGGMMAHYGKFSGCTDYIAMVGPKGAEENCGYYGEKLVLKAQQLGLNSCWVAMTYKKSKAPCVIEKGEKLHLVIAIGYGETQGTAHSTKPMQQLCDLQGNMPDWFAHGMEAAMLAPTAMNQQKFKLSLKDNVVQAKALRGFYTKIDLGIVKCHFEIGAGETAFRWE